MRGSLKLEWYRHLKDTKNNRRQFLKSHQCLITQNKTTRHFRIYKLCPNSAAASFEGCDHNCPNSSSFFSEDAPLLSFAASHIPRFFAFPIKKKERKKMVTSRGVEHHFRGRGRQKSWRKGKTSGDATRKCSEGSTVTFNDGWRVLRRMQPLNWDTATRVLSLLSVW